MKKTALNIYIAVVLVLLVSFFIIGNNKAVHIPDEVLERDIIEETQAEPLQQDRPIQETEAETAETENVTVMEDRSNLFYKLGQIEREYLYSISKNDVNDVFVDSPDFIIYESEITEIDERNKLSGIKGGREHAIRYLLRREILYNEALNQGFTAGHEEVTNMIKLQLESARSAVNYESDFLPFLSGLGMTDEEYFELQYDVYRKDIAIDKYYSVQHELISAENRSAAQEEIETMLQSYLQKLVEDYLEANSLQWAL